MARQRTKLVQAMNQSPLTALFVYFATLSLFAVGGANALFEIAGRPDTVAL